MIRAVLRGLLLRLARLREYREMRATVHLSGSERKQLQEVRESLRDSSVRDRDWNVDEQRLLLRGLRLLSTRELNREIALLGRAIETTPEGERASKLSCLIEQLPSEFRDWLLALLLPKLAEPEAAAHLLRACLDFAPDPNVSDDIRELTGVQSYPVDSHLANLRARHKAVVEAGDQLDPREPSEYVSKLIVACVRLAPPSDD